MAKRLKNHTLDQYLTVLAKKEPTPGGGSAAAMTAAMGAALLAMVTRYSIGKGHSKTVDNKLRRHLTKAEELRKKLTELVDRDAEAYQQVVKARGQIRGAPPRGGTGSGQGPRGGRPLVLSGRTVGAVSGGKGQQVFVVRRRDRGGNAQVGIQLRLGSATSSLKNNYARYGSIT